MQDAAMLFTGGKDSSMALHEARDSGYRIRCLVTFAPPERGFLAHPLAFIEMQARALELPHRVLTVVPPVAESYESGLRRLREEWGIDCVVTGDIAEVDGQPNWIRERSRPAGIDVHTPLWGRDRETLLGQFLERGFRARISCVSSKWLDDAWVGRELDAAAIAGLRAVRARNGLDLCGEEGAYHTLVTDGPPFARRIDIRAWSRRSNGTLAYLAIEALQLVDRDGRADQP